MGLLFEIISILEELRKRYVCCVPSKIPTEREDHELSWANLAMAAKLKDMEVQEYKATAACISSVHI